MTHTARAGRGWGPARLLLAVLLGCLTVLGAASPAAAHAELLGTDPTDGALLREAPAEVTLSFNEPVRLTAQEITVYDAEGQTVPSTSRTVDSEVVVALDDPSDLGRGTFVVGWFVVSADGHPISGSLTFSVGERSEDVAAPPPPPTSSGMVTAVQGAVTTLGYAGLLLAAGLVVFVCLLLPASYDGTVVRRRIQLIARLAALVAVLATALAVPVASVYAQGGELTQAVSGFDAALVADELVSLALAVVGLGAALGTLSDRAPAGWRRPVAGGGAVLALLAPVAAGHTRAYQPTALLVGADAVHLLAGAVWLGGLVGLALSLRALAGREVLAATTLVRFSTLAGGLLLAVAATGSVLAWRILGSWEPFLTTAYGRLLLVKIGLALVVAGLGAWNRFRLLPAVRSAAGFGDRGAAAGRVTRAVRIEALVLVVLLGVTGFLVNQSPRPAPVAVPDGRTGVQDATVADLEVYAALSPGVRGRNTLLVQLQDATGEPVVTPRAPEVELRTAGLDLGSVPLRSTDAGTWSATVLIPQAGVWEVQVGVRLSRFENPVSTVRFTVTDE